MACDHDVGHQRACAVKLRGWDTFGRPLAALAGSHQARQALGGAEHAQHDELRDGLGVDAGAFGERHSALPQVLERVVVDASSVGRDPARAGRGLDRGADLVGVDEANDQHVGGARGIGDIVHIPVPRDFEIFWQLCLKLAPEQLGQRDLQLASQLFRMSLTAS